MANRNTNICFSEKAETVYFWQNSKSDGKESDRRGKNDEIDKKTEYSRAMKSHFRKFGNQMSGSGNHLCNYASLLA